MFGKGVAKWFRFPKGGEGRSVDFGVDVDDETDVWGPRDLKVSGDSHAIGKMGRHHQVIDGSMFFSGEACGSIGEDGDRGYADLLKEFDGFTVILIPVGSNRKVGCNGNPACFL